MNEKLKKYFEEKKLELSRLITTGYTFIVIPGETPFLEQIYLDGFLAAQEKVAEEVKEIPYVKLQGWVWLNHLLAAIRAVKVEEK